MTAPLPKLLPSNEWNIERVLTDPWFAPIRQAAEKLQALENFPTIAEMNEAFAPLVFRETKKVTRRRARKNPIQMTSLYDGVIHLEGEIPTRVNSWHDLFNALVWASFPNTKKAINQAQFEAQRALVADATRTLPNSRTRIQDKLTMADEGGVLLVTHDAAAVAQAFNERETFAPENFHGEVRYVIFGHAIYEHLISSEAPVHATAWILEVDRACELALATVHDIDDAFASELMSKISERRGRVRIDADAQRFVFAH